MRTVLCVFLLTAAAAAQSPLESREWVNRGVQAYKGARYAEAVEAFQKAVALDPGFVTARLYLATAYMQQVVPGSESPENVATADRAEAEFRRVLSTDASNQVALKSLGSLALNRKRWDDARAWYRQLLSVDPNEATAYYTLGFIAWSQWYPAYAAARQKAGLRPQDPGPIGPPAIRADLRAQFGPTLDDGIWNLQRALEINPKDSDAMAYMNLLVRERADLKDTAPEYQAEIAEADSWVQKALAAKKELGGIANTFHPSAPPPPPPPPPPPGAAGNGDVAGRVRVSGDEQRRMLQLQVPPVYPPLAMQARIQGTVRFDAVIGKDGSVVNLKVVSGHPLLVPSALDAVRQWRYQPALLNGQPVEVVAPVEVSFTLP